jgi:hypothetical protein
VSDTAVYRLPRVGPRLTLVLADTGSRPGLMCGAAAAPRTVSLSMTMSAICWKYELRSDFSAKNDFCLVGVPTLPVRGPCAWFTAARLGLAVREVTGEPVPESIFTAPRGLFDLGIIAMLVSFECWVQDHWSHEHIARG